ncbi:MAG: hypothetical protein M1596_06275, partial [Firmicutes bacterium]|nr:hypothetical protein [Bacillota bacterium]
MTDGATICRTESPSVVELTSGEQPENHAGQFACCQHQRVFLLAVHGSFELPRVKRVKFRVAHTNPAGRPDLVIPTMGIARPRERSIFRVKMARLMGPSRQPRIFCHGVVRREPGAGSDFGHNVCTIDQTNTVYRGQGLGDHRQISGNRLINLPDLTLHRWNGVHMHHQVELVRLGSLGSEAKGLLRQPLQTPDNVLRRFQRWSVNHRDFLRVSGPWCCRQTIRRSGQDVLRGPNEDIREIRLFGLFGQCPITSVLEMGRCLRRNPGRESVDRTVFESLLTPGRCPARQEESSVSRSVRIQHHRPCLVTQDKYCQ